MCRVCAIQHTAVRPCTQHALFFSCWVGGVHAMPGSVKRAAGGPSPPELWFWIPECPTRDCTEAAFKRARVQSYVNEVFTEPCQACNLSCENCISEYELDSNFAGSCFCTSRPGAAPPFVHTQSDSRQCSETPYVFHVGVILHVSGTARRVQLS